MARHKHGPALFEVFDASQGLATPRPSQVPDAIERPTGTSARPVPHSVQDEFRADYPAEAGDVDTQKPEVSFIQLEGDRVTVTFTTKRAAITIFVGLGLLAFTFSLGDRLGSGGFRRGFEAGRALTSPDSTDEMVALRNQPAATHVLDGLLVASDGAPTGPKPAGSGAARSAGSWLEGVTYVVIQEFGTGSGDEAAKARNYLAGRGVASEAVQLPNGAIQLMATQGFNMKDAAQKQAAEQFLDKIHRLGTDYYAAGGRYRLKGYFKTIKSDG